MDRRGALEGLKETIVLVLEVMAALLLLALLVWGVMLFFSEPEGPASRDFSRVFDDLVSLPANAAFRTPTEGSDYILVLLPPGNDEAACGKKACLCLERPDRLFTCKAFPPAITAAGKKGACASLCVRDATSYGVRDPGQGVMVCSENYELGIGPLC